jgi:hypothetical protein
MPFSLGSKWIDAMEAQMGVKRDAIYRWNHETGEITKIADDIVEALTDSQRRS